MSVKNRHAAIASGGGILGRRQLDHYPATAARRMHLLLVVAITVSLYYALYVAGGVAPLIMRELRMPFSTFVYILALANLFGAFASLLAGLCDRFGRANLVVWGLLVVGVLTLVGIPLCRTAMQFAAASCVVGFVEGIILVATPALIRDFSPQVGRATAMGVWAIGPVLGSLLVSSVATTTLDEAHWRTQYEICGVLVLVLFVIALLGLRELKPEIRDQVMVSERDRSLIEWRARQNDVAVRTLNPWKQMLRADIIGPALGVSCLLLFYYTAVAFGVVFSVTMFGFDVDRANSLANWGWAANAIALVAAGIASDRLRVRKPFMVVGALGALVCTIWYLSQPGSHPAYGALALIIALQAAFTGCAYGPWMASFTETVEAHNPALTATGLAIWGWLLRLVVTISFLVLPFVVTTVTEIVQAPIWIDAMQAAEAAHVAPAPEVIAHLKLLRHAVDVAPGQWRLWFLICAAGIVVFIGFVFPMRGRWSPAAGLRDEREHDRLMQAEYARMRSSRQAAE